MGLTWRTALAVTLAVLPPVAIALWPAPAPAAAPSHAAHGDHSPAAVRTHQGHIYSSVPQGYGAEAWDGHLPPWPDGGRLLEVGHGKTYADLAEALASARDGDHIVLLGGIHLGNFEVNRRVWIEGRNDVTISGGGKGSVFTVTAPGARLSGLMIHDSGDSLDSEDAGVSIKDADGAVVAGCHMMSVQFGVQAKNAQGALIAGNTVVGRPGDLSLMGDGIRAWHSDEVRILFNTVRATREILVESTIGATISGNAIVDGRQGLHLMRAMGAKVTGNYLGGNSTGIYVMYGDETDILGNRLENNRGPSGYGVGLKEANSIRIEGNWFLGNRAGIYLDRSPLDPQRPNQITSNLIAYNDVGVSVTPATEGNLISQNDFLDNFQQVGASGGGQPAQNRWTVDGKGNHWSDYAAYDDNGDGVGDLPHAPLRVFEQWMDRQPDLKWFWFTPASSAVDLAARAFPIAAQDAVLVDEKPVMAPVLRRDDPWLNYRK